MFEQTFVQTGKTNTTWTVLMSTGIQVVVIGVFVVLPLVFFDVLPNAQLTSFLVAPPPPPPPPPPPAAAPPKVVKVVPRTFDSSHLVIPKVIPKDIKVIQDEEAPSASVGVPGGVPGGVAGGSLGGVLGGILNAVPTAAPPPPPPPPKKEAPKGPIPIGGRVQAAKLINQPQPLYPPLAKQARVSGVVELAATIGKDGRIIDLKVVKGHPLLVAAALAAVRQWVYKPTLLNDEPVEVSTTIDVNFTLNQ